MSNQIQMSNVKTNFDLEERTSIYGEDIIMFAKTLAISEISRSPINQLIRSATSIGANYMEADSAESRKDFAHKMGICKKEAKETRHWLRMIAKTNPEKAAQCRKLWQEAHELLLIFSTIIKSTRTKKI